jgi:predicted HD phosphohydrolase
LHEDLVSLVSALDGIQQSPRYHPEGDALYHSLQVFQLAQRESADRVMWAAALFHDVGKAIDGPSHDEVGADLLEGLLPPRAVWLVRHHLDLMKDPRRTRRRYGELPIMRELQQLRRWDERGRDPKARVMSLHQALDALYAGQPRELFLDLDGTFDPEER